MMFDDPDFWAMASLECLKHKYSVEDAAEAANLLVAMRKKFFDPPTPNENITLVDHLMLPVRPRRILAENGIKTIEQLLSMSWAELDALEGMGTHSMRGIAQALKDANLTLKMPYKIDEQQ